MTLTQFQRPRTQRRESRNLSGKFRGGKLAPIMAVPFRESESGVINQVVQCELDPIAGRMITPITLEVTAVYVPVQAIDLLKNPTETLAGSKDLIRQKLLSGTALFGLEAESELSQRMGIVPRSIGGVKKVCEISRLAHNCAVNYLRRQKYVKAVQLLAENMSVTPALINQTVLDRLDAVLDPEDRVNGAVNFTTPSVTMNVDGIGVAGVPGWAVENMRYTGETSTVAESASNEVYAKQSTTPGYPEITTTFPGISGVGISLTDFYQAERMDALVRIMRKMVDENPEFGEEMVANFAHGLSVDVGKQPFVVYRKNIVFGMQMRYATDGANLDTSTSDLAAAVRFTVPVPPTEFGGIVVTFASVKPDETIASQPHPVLSEEWGAINYVADELAIDPVPVTIRDLNGDCDVADEGTIAMYVGNNHLKRNYTNYGFTRNTNPLDVATKTALWQLELPMSVTPETVVYPDDISHYPFADQMAEVATYIVTSNTVINTPMVFGPTPVEELAAIETEDVFEEQ